MIFVLKNILKGSSEKDDHHTYPDDSYNFGVSVAAHGLPGDWNEQVRRFVEKVDLPVAVDVGFLDYSKKVFIDHYNAVRWVEQQYYDQPGNVVRVDMNED